MADTDHPFIAQAREHLDIGQDENAAEALARRFVTLGPRERKAELAGFAQAQSAEPIEGLNDMRKAGQLGRVRRELQALDARLKRNGL